MPEQVDNFVVRIRSLREEDIRIVALLHEKEILYGFASQLGSRFLKYLYRTVINCEDGFGLVAEDKEGQLIGFLSGTINLGRLYKKFMRRYFLIAGLVALPRLLRWKAVKSLWQDLFYGSEEKRGDLPEAEIISVVVRPEARGWGVGRLLTMAAFEEFRSHDVSRIKVLVGEKLGANEFYCKMGFKLVTHITYNSAKMNANVYVKDLFPDFPSSP